MSKSLLFILIVILLPIALIFSAIFSPVSELAQIMFDKYLSEYLKNTFMIILGTLIFAGALGVALAYFEAFYEFSFQRIFKFLLVLPFAFPSYLYAYIYSNILSPNSYLSDFTFRQFGKIIDIDIMNIYGCVFILSISFFPYLYILLRSHFSKIDQFQLDAARVLGCSNFAIFFRLIMPLSAPIITAGLSLIAMESLNAYGMPNYFGIDVLSTAIYKAWINYKDLNAAIRLSAFMLIFVFFAIFVTKLISQKSQSVKFKNIQKIKLSKFQNFAVVSFFSFVVFITVVLPIIHLIYWLSLSFKFIDFKDLMILAKNSFLLSFISAFFIVVLSLFLSAKLRNANSKFRGFYCTFINLGYSIPGSVIGIALLIIFIKIDKFLRPVYNYFGIFEVLYFTNSIVILIYAYVLRFLALGFLGIDSALKKLGNRFYQAGLSLGKSPLCAFLKIDLILIFPSCVSAFILVFIDVIKELPLASLLAGAKFSTLAFEMDRYASDEQLAKVAAPGLLVVLSCLILLIIFANLKEKNARA